MRSAFLAAIVATVLLAGCRSPASVTESTPAFTPRLEVLHLRFASAPEIARELDSLFATHRDPAQPVFSIIADERTNSLLVSGSQDDVARVVDLVSKLDRDVTAK